jgi:hypothetical protein
VIFGDLMGIYFFSVYTMGTHSINFALQKKYNGDAKKIQWRSKLAREVGLKPGLTRAEQGLGQGQLGLSDDH